MKITEIAIRLIETRCASVGKPIDAQQGVIIVYAIEEAIQLAQQSQEQSEKISQNKITKIRRIDNDN